MSGAIAVAPVGPAYYSCPRFDSCSCNDCPLDPQAAMHGGSCRAVDGEEECRARRTVRERVASDAGLPAGFALLPRERNSDARRAAWTALPADVQAQRRGQLEEARRRASALKETGVLEATSSQRGNGADDALGVQSPVSGAAGTHEREASR